MSNTHIQDHIELIARHEQEFLSKRTPAERAGDSIAVFVGSFSFVVAHTCVFILWVFVNTVHLPNLRHFDPRPFSLLSTLVGMEAILLVSFVLMRQLRTGKRSEEREHLMLQVLLLSERELTLLLRMNREIAESIGLNDVAGSKEVKELSKTMSVEGIAKKLRESMPSD